MLKVAQCWDDGVYTDFRLMDILRKYGAKATFNLCPGTRTDKTVKPSWRKAGGTNWTHKGFLGGSIGLKDMKDAYKDFEVASHCWKHECAEMVDEKVFLKAALDARKFLEDMFQKPCHGFAWPCGQFTERTCNLLREAGFEYGRTTLNTDDVLRYRDPMMLKSNCYFQDNQFYELYENAKKNGNKFFYFWGHSYEMMDSEGLWQQLEDKIQYISEDPEAEWCNVIDIVREPCKI